jgi:hypothetical protein
MTITADTVRYIKLGKNGRWADIAIERGQVHFGHGKVPHEMGLAGDRRAIKALRMEQGRDARSAADDAREVVDFYQLGPHCLWITFANSYLWWAFAEPEVTWHGGDGKLHGERVRKCIGGWRNTDLNGVELRFGGLSTKLTKVASYRRTLCAVEAHEYLLRRINGIEDGLVPRGTAARTAFLEVITEALSSLHWADFETLVDVIFARSGWHRASAIGGTQKLVDMVLEQPTTGERAAVQVKSAASQKILDQYVDRIDEQGTFARFFFICHSPNGTITAPQDRGDIHVWTGPELASTVMRLGLSDWVLERASV